jgi:hypothetical protein
LGKIISVDFFSLLFKRLNIELINPYFSTLLDVFLGWVFYTILGYLFTGSGGITEAGAGFCSEVFFILRAIWLRWLITTSSLVCVSKALTF